MLRCDVAQSYGISNQTENDDIMGESSFRAAENVFLQMWKKLEVVPIRAQRTGSAAVESAGWDMVGPTAIAMMVLRLGDHFL